VRNVKMKMIINIMEVCVQLDFVRKKR